MESDGSGGAEGLFVVALAGIVIYLIFDTYFMGKQEWVKATHDQRTYLVRALPDKAEAANLLAQIREKLLVLIAHLEKISPDDQRTQQIVQNFRPDKISEGPEKEGMTSYAVNKGESITFCLRQKNSKNTLVNLNTLMFVALHELTHVGTEEVGHTDTFWKNFAWILSVSIDIGIYVKEDFQAKPVKYCGIEIESSPLDGNG